MPPELALRPLPAQTPAAVAQASDVLWSGFEADPMLAWCFGAGAAGYEQRLRGYFEVGHRWHGGVGHPITGAFEGKTLIGVAYSARPEIEASETSLDTLWRDLRDRCGDESTERFRRYNEAVDAVTPEGRFLGLSLLAVRREHQGRGVGSALLRALCEECDRTPELDGIVLDTATHENLRFYARFGFAQVAVVPVPEIHERLLLRPPKAAR